MKNFILLAFFINVLLTNILLATTITLTSGEAKSGHLNQGEEKHYKITMSTGQSLNSVLNGLTADNDLYVKMGSVATKHSFDCKSAKGSTQTDSCSITAQHNTTAYITIIGYRTADYILTATLNAGNNLNISDSVTKGETKFYTISASAGQTLNTILNGLNDDADLYVRVGAKPTGSTYDCRSDKGGASTESCSTLVNQNATVHIAVYGYKATNYTLTATLNGNGTGDGITILTSAQSVSGSVIEGDEKRYKIDMASGQSLNSVLNGLSADNDLYVKMDTVAKKHSFDCKSARGGTATDSCSITADHDTTVYITVIGYRSADYTLTATIFGNNVPTLASGETIEESVARDSIKYYKISGLSGDKVTATISELTADADIYLKKGSQPSTSSFDCKSTNGGTNSDSCSIDLLQDEDVYIGVYGFRTTDYNLVATSQKEIIPANPAIPTILEDAEGGTLNPNWITARGDKPGYIYPTPDIDGAPSGTGVMVHHANGQGDSLYRYELPLNITSQRVLSMDCGGLPTHQFENQSASRRGYIVHHSIGVIVDTKLGERFMNWDSWYNHQGWDGPRKDDNGHNVFLKYLTPVEMVSGYYKSIYTWTHFEVNLDDELHRLEPDNDIIRIKQFFTTGGFLDNITLSQAHE